MSKIKTLIVDDEPLGREAVRNFLSRDPEIELAGESTDGAQAVAAIQQQRPDLVFLDVQMPEMDGLDVIANVGPENMPVTVFVTAHDKYTLQAFDANALDYLLKPFDAERFHQSLKRAKKQIQTARKGAVGEKLLELLQSHRPNGKHLDRLVVKSAGKVVFLTLDEVDWIEAAGNYLKLHAGSEVHTVRETMNRFEAKLDPDKFMRIHRGTIVNVSRIKELRPWFTGEYVVLLRDGKELTLSRTYRDRLETLLKSGI